MLSAAEVVRLGGKVVTAEAPVLAPVKCKCGKLMPCAAPTGTLIAIFRCRRCGFTGTVVV